MKAKPARALVAASLASGVVIAVIGLLAPLPDPVAVQWRWSGRPSASAPPLLVVLVAPLLLLTLGALAWRWPSTRLGPARVQLTVVGWALWCLIVPSAVLVLATNWGASSWELATHPGGGIVPLLLLAPLALFIVAAAMSGRFSSSGTSDPAT